MAPPFRAVFSCRIQRSDTGQKPGPRKILKLIVDDFVAFRRDSIRNERGNLLVGPASRAGLATANIALVERKSGSARRTY